MNLLKRIRHVGFKSVNRTIVLNNNFATAPSQQHIDMFGNNQLSLYEATPNEVKVFEKAKSPKISEKTFKRGEMVTVKVTKMSPLGALVDVNNKEASGLVLTHEVDLFNEKLNGEQVRLGQLYQAYVEKVNDDGRLSISFRPQSIERLKEVQEQILNAIQLSPTGELPIGDKSPVDEVALFFKGVSKHDFKSAVGRLFKLGLVKPGPNSIALMTATDQKPGHVMAHLQKTHLLPLQPTFSIFVGNLPQTATSYDLLTQIEDKVGIETVSDIRMVKNEVTGVFKGYAFVDFHTEHDANYALRKLKYVTLFNKKPRVKNVVRGMRVLKVTADTPGAYPIVPPKPDKKVDDEFTALNGGEMEQYTQISSGATINKSKKVLNEVLAEKEQLLALSADNTTKNHRKKNKQQQIEEDITTSPTPEIPLSTEDGVYGFDLDPDFDPETDYYVFDDEDDEEIEKIRRLCTPEPDEEVNEEDEEVEDYNKIELYRPQGGFKRDMNTHTGSQEVKATTTTTTTNTTEGSVGKKTGGGGRKQGGVVRKPISKTNSGDRK